MKGFQSIAILSVVAGSLFFAACKKDRRLLGNEAVPEEDVLNAASIEGIAVNGYSEKYDSIVSLNSDIKYLGSNDDATVGRLEVGLYTNFNISVSDLKFGTAAQLVSAEIVLAVSNNDLMGNTTESLTVSVYALDSVLKSSRAYYTSNTRLHSSQLLGTAVTGSTTVKGVTAVRIPIDLTYAANLLKDTVALASNTAMQTKYKGFYIKATSTGEGIIYRCDLGSDVSGLILSYKKTPTDTVSSFRFTFNGTSAARFNTVKFTPVSGLTAQFAGDTTQGAQRVYLKGMGAAKARVYVPWLKNYGDTFKVAINRAELFFYLDDVFAASLKSGSTQYYSTPPQLCLYALDSLGRETTLQDLRNANYVSRFNGSYDSENKRYAFNIPLHAQAILRGKIKNYGFALVIADSNPLYTAFRDLNQQSCILQGAATAKKPTFRLDYIRLKGE